MWKHNAWPVFVFDYDLVEDIIFIKLDFLQGKNIFYEIRQQ
jgi:hypothetical protein